MQEQWQERRSERGARSTVGCCAQVGADRADPADFLLDLVLFLLALDTDHLMRARLPLVVQHSPLSSSLIGQIPALSRPMSSAPAVAFALPRLSPLIHHLPGATPASQAACQRLLIENHHQYNIFEQNNIFHNHLAVSPRVDALLLLA